MMHWGLMAAQAVTLLGMEWPFERVVRGRISPEIYLKVDLPSRQMELGLVSFQVVWVLLGSPIASEGTSDALTMTICHSHVVVGW